jgi:hypothetical protein
MDVPTMFDIFVSYGFETDDELTDDRKLEALNETYWDACGREEWPFLAASVSLTFSGSSGIPTNDPGDIGQVVTANRVVGGTLEPWRYDDFYEYYGSQLTMAGSPVLYYFEGDTINFYPVPGTADGVLLKYIRKPDELTLTSIESDIKFPKQYHRSVLVMGTLSKLAVMQDDTDLGAAYERLYEKALATMVGNVFKQQSQRTEFIHVNDPDNWEYS